MEKSLTELTQEAEALEAGINTLTEEQKPLLKCGVVLLLEFMKPHLNPSTENVQLAKF